MLLNSNICKVFHVIFPLISDPHCMSFAVTNTSYMSSHFGPQLYVLRWNNTSEVSYMSLDGTLSCFSVNVRRWINLPKRDIYHSSLERQFV